MIEVIAPGRKMYHMLLGREVLVIAATIGASNGTLYTILWYNDDQERQEEVAYACELDEPERGDILKVSLN